MNELLNYSSGGDLTIHVSFRLGNDSNYIRERTRVEEFLKSLFKDHCVLEHEDPSIGIDREVVFMISRPIILSTEAHREFFIKLETLFQETNRYLPTFTQSVGETE